MNFFGNLASLFGSAVTPVMLFLASAVAFVYSDFAKVLSPRRFFRMLGETPDGQRSSPFRALSVALAGTLGVGNITGVASALIMGGAGAVFWMWAGALVVLPVKYAETFLAVKYRRSDRRGFFGGAMFYIRDGFSSSSHVPYYLGGAFALLCCLNSLVTGNLVQSNAAACVFPKESRLWCGITLAALVLLSVLAGAEKINRITSAVIPPLCAVYILIALYIVLSNITLLPSVFSDIFSSAFSVRALGGGAVGFTLTESMRYGVMRGIFSNEAGCGTSPTAHASADTPSPHHQACYGVVEVVFDTHVLCTLTALVLLIADRRGFILPWGENCDVSPVTLGAFTSLTGDFVFFLLVGAIFLFAFSTVIAQFYYGSVALRYFGDKKTPRVIYSVLSVVFSILGALVSAPVMWTVADILIGIMTAVNCAVIVMLRRRLSSHLP